MKKLFSSYSFLCLLVLSMLVAMPFFWRQMLLEKKQDVSADAQISDLPAAPQQPEKPEKPPQQPEQTPPAGDASGSGETQPGHTDTTPDTPVTPPSEDHPTPPETTEQAPAVSADQVFQNALFIGDSRTVGISEYAGIDDATFFASTGMSVYTVFKETVPVSGKGKLGLSDLLSGYTFDRIYLMLGINELGYNFDKTVQKYSDVVEKIKALQPNAVVIIEANLHVTQKRSDSDSVFNNTNIDRFNDAISKLSDGKSVYYLDVNPLFDDKNGSLSSDYSADNAHILGKYYAKWGQWLAESTPA